MHTQKPFNMATDRATADEVAISHYEWIKHGLAAGGIDPNAHNIAMAWNCGLSAVLGGRVPTESYRYAEQVCNLVDSFKQRAQTEAAVAVAATKAPAPVQSEFQVQFEVTASKPHFVLLSEAEAPLLVVSTEAPRTLSPLGNPLFSLASAD
jgi:hypothetical protein